MTKEQKQDIISTIEKYGFDFTFYEHKTFAEIDDKEFHKLRCAYVKSRIELGKYIGMEDI